MDELKELKKLEEASADVSTVLQKHYEVEPVIADELALYFLSNNFQAVKEEAIRKAKRKKVIEKHGEAVLGILFAACVAFGIVLFLYNSFGLPRYGAVGEDFKFSKSNMGNCTNGEFSVCVPRGSEGAFEYQIQNLPEGESIDMQGEFGHVITLTKRGHQISFVEHHRQ